MDIKNNINNFPRNLSKYSNLEILEKNMLFDQVISSSDTIKYMNEKNTGGKMYFEEDSAKCKNLQ